MYFLIHPDAGMMGCDSDHHGERRITNRRKLSSWLVRRIAAHRRECRVNSGQVGEQANSKLSIHCSMALDSRFQQRTPEQLLAIDVGVPVVSQPVTSLGKEEGSSKGAQHVGFRLRQLAHFLWRLKDTTGGLVAWNAASFFGSRRGLGMPPTRSVVSHRETGFFARSEAHCILCEKQFGSKPLNCRDMDRVIR